MRTRAHLKKFSIFDQKIRQEVKKSVSFVRYPSCGETTIYITFLKSLSVAVLNIMALQHSQMSELHFEIPIFLAKKMGNPPKKESHPLKDGSVFIRILVARMTIFITLEVRKVSF